MRMPMFKTREERREFLLDRADAIEASGLRIAKELLEDAKKDIGKEEFTKNYNPDDADEIWLDHMVWLEDQVKYLERKIKTLRKQAMA